MTDDEQNEPKQEGHVPSVAGQADRTSLNPMAFREIVWIVASGAILIYLLALPIRIQYWRVNFEAGEFQELRRWMLVRDVWSFQFRNMPTFGSEMLMQVLFVLSAVGILIGVILGLRVILLQDGDPTSGDVADAG